MPFRYIGQVGAIYDTPSSGSVVCPFSQDVPAGVLVVAVISVGSSQSVMSVTDDAALNTWAGVGSTTNTRNAAVYYSLLDNAMTTAAGSSVIAFLTSSAVNKTMILLAFEVTGSSSYAGSQFGASAVYTSATSNAGAANGTNGGSGGLVVSGVATAATQTTAQFTPNAAYTKVTAGVTCTGCAAYAISADSTTPADCNWSWTTAGASSAAAVGFSVDDETGMLTVF